MLLLKYSSLEIGNDGDESNMTSNMFVCVCAFMCLFVYLLLLSKQHCLHSSLIEVSDN